VETLWRHSVIAAIVGGAIARELGESEGNAFTAGLLHDVGKIILSSAEGEKYAEMLQKYNHSGDELNQAEMIVFGFGHGEIGARLLSKWNLPAQVFLPVMCHHHKIWLGSFNRLAAIVNLANLMAHHIETNAPDQPFDLPEAIHAMELLDLTPEDMPALHLLARNDIDRLGQLFTTIPPQ
jgi:putative nucleotidyltransferase with HDIG domain